MKIIKVETQYLRVSVQIPVRDQPMEHGALLVTIETDTGIRGVGMVREEDPHCLVVRAQLQHSIIPFLIGRDPLSPERIWNEAAWTLSRSDFRVPTGSVARAISTVDQALWDIRGQHYGQPVYRLLGGSAKDEIDIYMTFGFNFYNPEEEAEAARRLLAQGHTAFKLQGAVPDRGKNTDHDVARVKALREIVGDKAEIILDGRNDYDLYHAKLVAKKIEPCNVAYFDDPMYAKDPQAMRELRRFCPGVPIAARVYGGNIWGARDLIAQDAVDVMGTSVMDGGGFTQSLKVAHMAEMHQLPLVTGGGWHLQNAHLIAAVNNGWMTEFHALAALVCDQIFVDPIKPEKGKLRLSQKPGLGLQVNEDAVREAVARGRTAERA